MDNPTRFAFVLYGEIVRLDVDPNETFASARHRALVKVNMAHAPEYEYEIRDGIGRLVNPLTTFKPYIEYNAKCTNPFDQHVKFFISIKVGFGG